MTNGLLIGLALLAGVSLGWFALPVCLSIIGLVLLVENRNCWSLVLACLIFSTAGAIRSDSPAPPQTSDELANSTGAIGVVRSFPRPSGNGHRVMFEVTDICMLEQCIPAHERVLLYVARQEPPIARGQTMRVDWRLQSLGQLSPGYRGFVRAQGATAHAYASEVELIKPGPRLNRWLAETNESIASGLALHLPGDTGALATGIVNGDDSQLSDDTREKFRATGTSHITSVSGQNVTIILGFLTLWWTPKQVFTRGLFHLFLLVVIWSYALLVGLEPPAIRAAVVASISVLSSHVGRRADPVTSLVLTLGVMAYWQPIVAHSVGFWLSATASGALCLVFPRTLEWRSKRWWAEVAGGPIVASLATMPIALATFGTWSPVSIVANILISPVITLAFLVTYPFTILALVAPPLATIVAPVPGILLDIALLVVEWFAPRASSFRVESTGPFLMIALWIPIASVIWLLSRESQRWLRPRISFTRT